VLLTVFLLAADLLVLAWSGPAPAGRITDDPHVISWSDMEHAESQVASLESALGNARKPFNVFMGESTANQAIDPAVLQEFDPCHTPAMGLCTLGTGMSRIREIGRPLFHRRLRPSLALLGVNAISLVGSYHEDPPNSINPVAPLTHGDWRESVRRLRWWNWFSKNHASTEHRIMRSLIDARDQLNVSPRIEPWKPPHLIVPDHATPEYIRAQMAGLRLDGCFDPQRYLVHRDEEVGALEELVSQYQELGTEVILLILPEPVALRSQVPPAEQQFLIDSVTRRFGSASPAILNLRDALPEELFSDLGHLNNTGRATFSRQLAQILRNRQSGAACPR
jgi:hypothetical protein